MVYILPIAAVILSFGFVWFIKPKDGDKMNLLLAFSGAFLLAMTFFELLPSVYAGEPDSTIPLFIMIGILLQIFLEFFSKGAEHGHMHFDIKKRNFPIILFLSLSIHALVEGVPLQNENMLAGILIHKIPVAMLLSLFLLNSELKKSIVVLFMALFALMTPLGSYITVETELVSYYGNQLNALAIGIFFHISTIILFESAKGHSFNLTKLLVIVLGIGLAYFL